MSVNNKVDKKLEVEFNDLDVEKWIEEDEIQEESSIPTSTTESISEKYAKSQLRVVRETKDFQLDYLNHALQRDSFVIDVSPEYQRRQRWSLRKRSQLIESFLMNIPIPPIFLFEREYNEYEVVDGRQRLDTIRDFLSNKFALTGLTYWKELNRKRFNQLPQVIQKGLLRRSLSAIVLLAETRNPEDDDFDVRRVLFDRLNTGGEKLNPQELRNALYPGLFNKMLIEIARSDEFASIWGIPQRTPLEDEETPDELINNTLYKTMADCELVLRFFAIKEAIENKSKGSLSKLLDNCMSAHSKDTEKQISQLKTEYMRCLIELNRVFNGSAFRIANVNRPSRSLYDAMMVAVSLHSPTNLDKDKEHIQARLQKVLSTPGDYDLMVGGQGNTLENMKKRVYLASTTLYGEVRDERLS